MLAEIRRLQPKDPVLLELSTGEFGMKQNALCSKSVRRKPEVLKRKHRPGAMRCPPSRVILGGSLFEG